MGQIELNTGTENVEDLQKENKLLRRQNSLILKVRSQKKTNAKMPIKLTIAAFHIRHECLSKTPRIWVCNQRCIVEADRADRGTAKYTRARDSIA